MPKLLVPGHNYLGPGNPYPNGPATSSADRIAKKHDKSYIDAESENDILKSDWKYTKEFASDFVEHPSFGSAAGAVGLGLKTAAERVVGVQYPNADSMKRHHSGMISSSTNDVEMSSEIPVAASAAGGGGGGGGGMVAGKSNIYQGAPQNPNYIDLSFDKTYHFFATNDLPTYNKPTPAANAEITLRMNYIQNLPVDRLRLYMSPREEAVAREQFSEVNCNGVSVEVYSLGARGQFQTGGTGLTNANMQLQPYIGQFHGIDKDFPTQSTEANITAFLGKLEGSNPYTVAASSGFVSTIPSFPARSGSRSMDVPLEIVYPNPFSHANNAAAAATSAVENQLNWPNIYEYVDMRNGAVLTEGAPTFSYEYTPKNKYLFGRNNFTRAEAYVAASGLLQPLTLIQTQHEHIMRTQDTQNGITSGVTDSSPALPGNFVLARNQQPNNVRIENQYQHNGTEMFKPHRMPRFMFGVMPLRNTGGENTNQAIQWEFLLKTKIHLRCQLGIKGHYGHTLLLPEPKWMFPTIQKGTYGSFGASNAATDTGAQIASFSDRRHVFGRPTFTQGATVAIAQQTGSTVNGITPSSIVTRSARKKKDLADIVE